MPWPKVNQHGLMQFCCASDILPSFFFLHLGMFRLSYPTLTHFSAVWILLILWGPALVSQNQPIRCATNEAEAWMQSHYDNWPDRSTFERWMQTHMANPSLRDEGLVTIPVVVHVIHDGDPVGFGSNISAEQIQSQIDVLNEDYRRLIGTPGHNTHPDGADIEIEFCLVAEDPNGQLLPELGIHRIDRNERGWGEPPYSIGEIKQSMMPQEFWDPERYMNIWTAELSNDFLGFAQLPNFSTLPDLSPNHGPGSTDGVVITPTAFGRVGSAKDPYNHGRTTTHEVGHWLGLWHIWGDGACGVDDYCSDTPEASDPHYGCPDPGNSCGLLEMVNNYMDYSDDTCMNLFTVCQKNRMRTVISNSVRRFSLTESDACFGNAPPIARFSSNRQFVCEGSTVRFSAEEGNIPQSWVWSFPGGSPSTSQASSPVVEYARKGTYDVELIAKNEFGSDTLFLSSYIKVDTTGSEVIFFEDFENGLSRWEIENPDNQTTWQLELVDGSEFGQIAVGINLYDYTVSGERDALISPVLDLSGYKGAELYFGHAYRQATPGDRDSLIIYVSEDGGQSYSDRIFTARENGNQDFATNSPLNERFTPSRRDDWCYRRSAWAECTRINLTSLTGTQQFRLKFETYNGFGNDMYLDNISLEGSCVPIWEQPVDSVGHPFLFTLFPNPNEGIFSLRVFMDEPQEIELRLFDMKGREIFLSKYEEVQELSELKVETENLPNGIYLLRIRAGRSSRFTKLIIAR